MRLPRRTARGLQGNAVNAQEGGAGAQEQLPQGTPGYAPPGGGGGDTHQAGSKEVPTATPPPPQTTLRGLGRARDQFQKEGLAGLLQPQSCTGGLWEGPPASQRIESGAAATLNTP